MSTGWDCLTYMLSDLPLTCRVTSVFTVRVIIVQDEQPSAQMIEDLVVAHTCNSVPLMTEVSRIDVPDELL